MNKIDIEEKFKDYFKGAATLYFDLEFAGNTPHSSKPIIVKPPFKTVSILYLERNYQEVAIVIPQLGMEYQLIPLAVSEVVKSIVNGKTVGGGTIIMGGDEFDSRELSFNRVIYIFTERLLVQKSIIEEYLKPHNIRVKIRDTIFFEKEWNARRPDVFICHDSRDKEDVVEPLYQELVKRNVKVWYDKASLKIGDSLSEKLEEGIRNCRFGVIILSKNFLSNERWAKNELQSFRTKQVIENETVILPVWHGITEDDLKKTSYWLVDKLGGSTKDLKSLADQIKNLVTTEK